LQLLGSKTVVEKTLIELDAIKVQLEEIAKERIDNNPVTSTPLVTLSTNPAPAVEPTHVDSEPSIELPSVDQQQEPTAASNSIDDDDDDDDDDDVEQTKVTESTSIDEVSLKLLKILHVYTSYSRVTGVALPQNLDYFGMFSLDTFSCKLFTIDYFSSSINYHMMVAGKTLLGLTSLAGFTQTLLLSRRSAQLYLDVSRLLCICIYTHTGRGIQPIFAPVALNDRVRQYLSHPSYAYPPLKRLIPYHSPAAQRGAFRLLSWAHLMYCIVCLYVCLYMY